MSFNSSTSGDRRKFRINISAVKKVDGHGIYSIPVFLTIESFEIYSFSDSIMDKILKSENQLEEYKKFIQENYQDDIESANHISELDTFIKKHQDSGLNIIFDADIIYK